MEWLNVGGWVVKIIHSFVLSMLLCFEYGTQVGKYTNGRDTLGMPEDLLLGCKNDDTLLGKQALRTNN